MTQLTELEREIAKMYERSYQDDDLKCDSAFVSGFHAGLDYGKGQVRQQIITKLEEMETKLDRLQAEIDRLRNLDDTALLRRLRHMEGESDGIIWAHRQFKLLIDQTFEGLTWEFNKSVSGMAR